MTTTWEERQIPASSTDLCPSWCSKEHTVDTSDMSGEHVFVTGETPETTQKHAWPIRLVQGFGIEEGQAVLDPAHIRLYDSDFTPAQALEVASALIYAATLSTELAPE